MVILSAEKVAYTYHQTPIIQDISFEVRPGEFIGLCGKNGSGKTTLLKCLGHILKPEGKVSIDGKNLNEIEARSRARIIGYVPQSIQGRISKTVFEAVLMGRKPYITWGVSSHDLQIVQEIISRFGLLPFASRDVFEISGGERQKALIARAIAQDPSILLLDEPTANLDLYHQLEVMEIISSIIREQGIAAVMAVHDLTLAMRYCSRVLIIHNHRIIGDGLPSEILTPDHIKTVYQVDAHMSTDGGIPHIVPIRASRGF
ncbi:MAG: ABC transporter ATP-binding protein [Methanospirillum sp.]|uniref:ABC transporter ATP-binding protein n=1 Tax=Methanospirillum sp. TaxID=45200 RepID=UPI002373C531|nr:ABC transporter ATP-binding protein [Methanospirillum sp.]MDD1728812.1 ABC transporter ATP-binding protein [Methanospirillum sp.]